MDPLDDESLASVLLRIGGVLLTDETVDRILELVTELTDRTVGRASAVSVTLSGAAAPYTATSSAPLARSLDEVQYRSGAGPCLESMATGERINTSVPEAGERWPSLLDAARQEGIGGILSVPLGVQDRSFGSLNIYARRAGRFEAAEELTATLLANQAAAVLANAVAFDEATALNAQLREALESRDLIGQAKGILMERERCDADAAFDILRRASQRTNSKLRDVAARLVDSVSDPGRSGR